MFNGQVHVAPGAIGTDSDQHIANLLLDAGAEIDAKPELEIYADDVKCSHGSTIGQLDEQALFYLQTRGLDEPEARAVLVHAFVAERLQACPITALQPLLADRIGDWLGFDPS